MWFQLAEPLPRLTSILGERLSDGACTLSVVRAFVPECRMLEDVSETDFQSLGRGETADQRICVIAISSAAT